MNNPNDILNPIAMNNVAPPENMPQPQTSNPIDVLRQISGGMPSAPTAQPQPVNNQAQMGQNGGSGSNQLPPAIVKLLQLRSLNQPGYVKGIPEKIFNLLDSPVQDSIMNADPEVMFMVKSGMMKNQSFMKAVESGDLPRAKSITDKYIQLYKLEPEEPANTPESAF